MTAIIKFKLKGSLLPKKSNKIYHCSESEIRTAIKNNSPIPCGNKKYMPNYVVWFKILEVKE